MDTRYTTDCPLHMTGLVNKHLREGLAKQIRERGLNISSQQMHLLLYIFDEDGISQKRLTELTQMTKVSTVKAANLLEANNLATRVQCSDDQRNKNIYLTPEGKKLEKKVHEMIDQHRKLVFQGIEPEEVAAYQATLKKMLKNIGT